MTRGKQTCRILKEIRRRIAEANDIEYVTSECRYKGECKGTCPRCEAEVRYLEQQLALRRIAGKAVILAGITALSACSGGGTANPVGAKTEVETAVDTVVPGTAACADTIVSAVDSVPETIPVDVTDLLVVGDVDIADEPEAGAAVTSEVISDNSELNKVVVGKIVDTTAPEDKIWNMSTVEVKPGWESIERYIKKHQRYPEAALADSIEGRVVVEMIIDSAGYITSPKISRGCHPVLEAEALDIVRGIPRVRPARVAGRNVACYYWTPIVFKVPEDSAGGKAER